MGQGHIAAEDKISCALHMFSMEVWDVQQLLRFLDEFQSFYKRPWHGSEDH